MPMPGNRTISNIVGACFWLLFCLSPASAAPASDFIIHNFMPDFWQFWEAAENHLVERQAELWQSLYVSKHQAVFDDLAGPCKDQWDPAWARSRYFPNLPKIVPAMRDAAENLPQKLEAARDRFRGQFPDMHWTGDIYVMASGYCFNGRAQDIQGRGAILFGMDATVALGQKDITPGMTHELFHRYHFQFFDFKASSNYPLWTTLWAEGMAQYVCEQLNPTASEVDLSHVPAGSVEKVDATRRELAADFLKKFSSTQEMDAKIWFNDIRSQDPVVPPRGGYELGVLVAKELAKRYSVQAMAHWPQSEAQPKIRAALEAIAQSPDKPR
jgi:hypothetical protein